MKLLTLLLSLIFLLGACGKESVKSHPELDSKYDYIEIEECTIPVLKEFKIKTIKNNGASGEFKYTRNISFNGKIAKDEIYSAISIHKHSVDSYDKYLEKVELLLEHKAMEIRSKLEINNFKGIRFGVKNPIGKDNSYYLFGPITEIDIWNLEENKDNYITYLLNYCQKTWKLDKEKDN